MPHTHTHTHTHTHLFLLNWMAKSETGSADLFVTVSSMYIWPSLREKEPETSTPLPAEAGSHTSFGATNGPSSAPPPSCA